MRTLKAVASMGIFIPHRTMDFSLQALWFRTDTDTTSLRMYSNILMHFNVPQIIHLWLCQSKSKMIYCIWEFSFFTMENGSFALTLTWISVSNAHLPFRSPTSRQRLQSLSIDQCDFLFSWSPHFNRLPHVCQLGRIRIAAGFRCWCGSVRFGVLIRFDWKSFFTLDMFRLYHHLFSCLSLSLFVRVFARQHKVIRRLFSLYDIDVLITDDGK